MFELMMIISASVVLSLMSNCVVVFCLFTEPGHVKRERVKRIDT